MTQVAHHLLISITDVNRAHFNAHAVRNVYVRLPEEDSESKEPRNCGKLRKTMPGTLDVAQRWREHYAQVFEGGGFSRGLASPCHFADVVHGDNCLIVGRQKGGEHALDLLQAVYESGKVVTLGPGPSHSQAVTFLGRTQTLRKPGIEHEPNKHHVPRSLKALGLTGARCVVIPGTDDVGGNTVSELSKLRRTAKWHEPQKKLKRRKIPRSVKN